MSADNGVIPSSVRPGAKASLRLERRVDGGALLVIDVPGEPVNTLTRSVMAELGPLLDEIERDGAIRAVVLLSGKPSGFIAGADLELVRGLASVDDGSELSRSGQVLLDRVEGSKKPFVAAIHGACLGGGLEVALACHARLATRAEDTRLGLPEVQLGLLPGLGGTQRLPALIGLRSALDLLLTGKRLDPRRAERVGLIGESVDAPALVNAAVERALALAQPGGIKKARVSAKRVGEFVLGGNLLGRKLFFREAKQRLLEKTHGNYPAPERILQVVETGLAQGRVRGLAEEAAAFGELAVTPEARELINIFFATNELKKDSGVDDPGVQPVAVEKVGVLGAGLMGAGIAYVSLTPGKLSVRLKDRDAVSVGRGLRVIGGLLDETLKRRRVSEGERARLRSELTTSTDYSGFRDAELVVEAVFEDLALKQQVLRDIEEHGHPRAIFATNTSAIPVTEIARAAQNPERVVGMHYFSPVDKMPLLEVVVGERTAPWVTASAVAVGKRQGKTVIVARDGAGFYTSRVLGPYLNEAAFILSEGVPIETIDAALVEWGFPVGPLALLDEVGIDVAAKVAEVLHEAFGDRMAPPASVQRLLADQRYGRKNQRGFYVYGEKKRGPDAKKVDSTVYALLGITPNTTLPKSEIAERCVLTLVNEAVRCLEEGILRSARDGDIGAVFGLGFPPFRGGPFRYIDSVGAQEIVRRLSVLSVEYGARFEPAPLLVRVSEQRARFN